MRNWYAGYCRFGINIVFCPQYWDVHVFDSKKERDEWVDKHYYENNNVVATAIKYKEVVECTGTTKLNPLITIKEENGTIVRRSDIAYV